ncbi:MAG: hypothetical protein AAF541_12265 [Pseudomonadota bacterium]
MNTIIPDPEILIGIAALGLTVTGFSGLISVLGRRSTGVWSDQERFQLGQLIETSLAVTFASFIPILVSMLNADTNALLVATALVAMFHLVLLVRGVTKNYRQKSSMEMLPNRVTAFMVTGGFVLIVASGFAVFGVIPGLAFLLVSNLLWLLMVAVIHFVFLLMTPGSSEDA